MVEIKSLVVTTKGEVLALDAKFNLTIMRFIGIGDAAMRDVAEEDPREVEASKQSSITSDSMAT